MIRVRSSRPHPDPLSAPPPVDSFDWSTWRSGVQATLVFIRRGDELLLIHKKTGLGCGKVNAPGGKLEPDETFEMCARREVEEELNIRVGALTHVAELRFLMSDYEDILCHAFLTDEFEGVPIETREADPIWVPIHQIPWSQMWADDVYWIPRVLIGERLSAAFSFVGEVMQTMKVEPLGARDLLSVSLEDL